jgi:hypothetical protein
MKPGNIIKWALNKFYTLDPTKETKVEPDSGQQAEGWKASISPPSNTMNFILAAALTLANAACSIRMLNWASIVSTISDYVYTTGLAPCSSIAIWTPDYDEHYLITQSGLGFYRNVYGVWAGDAFNPNSIIANNCISMAYDPVNAITMVVGNGGAGSDVAYRQAGNGNAWSNGNDTNGPYQHVAHDHMGRWVLVDASNNYRKTDTAGVASTAAAASPGFLLNTYRVLHTHHPADTLYDGDPGNQLWVAVTGVAISTSVDGDTWTTSVGLSAIGFTGSLKDLAYSAYETKLIALSHDGSDFYVNTSTDNGASWTAVKLNTPFATGFGKIACDGSGHWAIIASDGTADPRIYVSIDNGDTWIRVNMPNLTYYPNAVFVWYGEGSFMAYMDDQAGGNQQFIMSLRGEE